MVGLMWLSLLPAEGDAASSRAHEPAADWAVEVTFRRAVQLWADERFDALWDCGLLASRYRISQEAFIRAMRHRVVKPTCCWGQIRSVTVHLRSTDEAVIEARMGFDVKTLGTTVVQTLFFYVRQEEGSWRVALEDFLTKPDTGLPWALPGF